MLLLYRPIYIILLILVMAIGGRPKPEICLLLRRLGWTLLPKSATTIHSVVVDQTPKLSVERRTLYHWAPADPYYILTHFNGFSQSSFIKPYVKVFTFLNVAISVKVIWTWPTSAKRMRQRIKRKEYILTEHFRSIIKCAVIKMTVGRGPKVLYIKWSKGPPSGQFYAAATETLLLAYFQKALLSFQT